MDVIDGASLWTPVVYNTFVYSKVPFEYYVSRKCKKRRDADKIFEIILYIYIYLKRHTDIV